MTDASLHELRNKAAYHRREASTLYRKIAALEGYSPTGPKPTCLINVNGKDIGVSERQFSIMERLIRDNDADIMTPRADLLAMCGCAPNVLRVFLSQLRRRIEVAGVTIETIKKTHLRLNTIAGINGNDLDARP